MSAAAAPILRGVRVVAAGEPSPLVALRDAGAQAEAARRAVQALAAAFAGEHARMQALVAARLDQLATAVVELGLAVAEAVVGDVVAEGRADLVTAVRACLEQVAGDDGAPPTVVRLHPDDLAVVAERFATELPQLQLRPEPGLARGAVRSTAVSGR